MPVVSVVIPAYNVSRFIDDAIQCVLAQTFTDFELIIVNDGSTDDTLARCQRYDDPRIRVVDQQNRGLAGARNSGIREARGEFVALLDADDLWLDTKLARHVEHLRAQPDLGVSYSASRFMSEDGELLALYQSPQLTGITAETVLCRNPVGNGSAPVLRMSALRAIESTTERYGTPEPIYFDPDFRQSEDIECWTRIAATTPWRFEGLRDALTLYRLNGGGLSASVDKQFASWERFIEKARGYAPELIGRYGSLARAYQYRYLSRRAVWSDEPVTARRLLSRAFGSDWRIAVLEPKRTFATILAVLLKAILPARAWRAVEGYALTRRAQPAS